jgi:hypothetical protein
VTCRQSRRTVVRHASLGVGRRAAWCAQRGHGHPAERDAFTVLRTLPHGHVAAALGTARKIGLDRILDPVSTDFRNWTLFATES